ncbi:MAG: TIGR04211 family SH3 domain-containing protein [Gammaproteobacteria bacterium]|nr:TIGR04211 family SH3 domain-containing protein [Gammaproteobacteria bacterium]MDH5591331.1 TIGR04211 family SH3 domain-containing protein [Gammaproteobacteria bacterium]
MKKFIIHLVITASILAPLVSQAEMTRYVEDGREITLRNGKGVDFAIRKMLKSGTELRVLEEDPSGYSRVQTKGGTEGWVVTRYLSDAKGPDQLLASSEQKIANLELDLAKAKEEIQALIDKKSQADDESMALKETASRLQKELDDLRLTASDAVSLDNQNRQLNEKLQQIDNEMQSLVFENSALKDNDAKSWFLIGAAVLFGGVLLGLILPRLNFKRRDPWGNL